MMARLLEDCPDGWQEALAPSALKFLGLTKNGSSGPRSPGGKGCLGPISPGKSKRRLVVRNAQTLKEIKSDQAVQQLRGEGKAVNAYVIEGFPAGVNFVERIACSPLETNPRFSLSKTPGDGDCLFYAMADVANEVRGECASPSRAHAPTSVDALRTMVSDSLTDTELAFFRAANDL